MNRNFVLQVVGFLVSIGCALFGSYSFGHATGYAEGYQLSRSVAKGSPTTPLREPEMAYRHGIQIGQQMTMATLMPSALEKEKARQATIKLVKEADDAGLGLDCEPLNEYRNSK